MSYCAQAKQALVNKGREIGAAAAVAELGIGSVRSFFNWKALEESGQSLENQRPGPAPGTKFVLSPEELECLRDPDLLHQECIYLLQECGFVEHAVPDRSWAGLPELL